MSTKIYKLYFYKQSKVNFKNKRNMFEINLFYANHIQLFIFFLVSIQNLIFLSIEVFFYGSFRVMSSFYPMASQNLFIHHNNLYFHQNFKCYTFYSPLNTFYQYDGYHFNLIS